MGEPWGKSTSIPLKRLNKVAKEVWAFGTSVSAQIPTVDKTAGGETDDDS